MSRRLDTLWLLLLALCLLVAAVGAVFRGSGALLEHRIQVLETNGRKTKSQPDSGRMLKVAPAFVEPFGHGMGDADIAYAMANLLMLQHETDHTSVNGPALNETPRNALFYYRKALLLRPSWGNAWARLALVKAALGQTDAELEYAIVQARRLAPYEQQAASMSLQAAMMSWAALSYPAQNHLWSMIDEALSGSLRRQVIQWSLAYGLGEYVSTRLTPDEAEKLRHQARRANQGKASVFSGVLLK